MPPRDLAGSPDAASQVQHAGSASTTGTVIRVRTFAQTTAEVAITDTAVILHFARPLSGRFLAMPSTAAGRSWLPTACAATAVIDIEETAVIDIEEIEEPGHRVLTKVIFPSPVSGASIAKAEWAAMQEVVAGTSKASGRRGSIVHRDKGEKPPFGRR